ncbi:MAG: DNA polymerase III subunit delta', partial [Gammaproteobacteria bacterium]|nr:DNA polymerase III subunit delta' [Gammaproteobacteria bacterium]
MTEFLPWHEGPWRTLQEARRADRFPHALLISGPRGIGIGRFARQLAASFLCARPDMDGCVCNTCKSCRLIEAG